LSGWRFDFGICLRCFALLRAAFAARLRDFPGRFDALDESGGEAEFAAESCFASRHHAIICFVVFSGEVQETMEHEDAYFVPQSVTIGDGLSGGGFQRDGEVSGVGVADFGRCREAEDVGGLVLATEGLVEAAKGGVIGEQDFHFARKANSASGTIEETREAGVGELGWPGRKMSRKFDGDHWLGFTSLTDFGED
jgi:hypothetical protein